MLCDFVHADAVTLKCLAKPGEIVLDGAQLELGPLAELLVFRKRSLPQSSTLRLTSCGPVEAAFRIAHAERSWAYGQTDNVGVLRFRHGSPTEDDDLAKQQFLMALLRGATGAAMPRPSAQALTGAAGELLDNVEQHAGQGDEALATFRIDQGALWLAVGDAGRGMLPTYENFKDILTAKDALHAAVIEHRSSTGNPERGQGFRDLLRALRSLDASLRIRTGDASLETEGLADNHQWISREQVSLGGCVISAHVRW